MKSYFTLPSLSFFLLINVRKTRPLVTTISEASNEHIKNDLNAVRNLLRLTACQNNSKLYKYVVINGEDNEKLYEAMERIYQIDKREIDEEGRLCPSESIDKDYIFTKEVIGEIAKSLFSLPIETELTKKVNIKFFLFCNQCPQNTPIVNNFILIFRCKSYVQ